MISPAIATAGMVIIVVGRIALPALLRLLPIALPIFAVGRLRGLAAGLRFLGRRLPTGLRFLGRGLPGWLAGSLASTACLARRTGGWPDCSRLRIANSRCWRRHSENPPTATTAPAVRTVSTATKTTATTTKPAPTTEAPATGATAPGKASTAPTATKTTAPAASPSTSLGFNLHGRTHAHQDQPTPGRPFCHAMHTTRTDLFVSTQVPGHRAGCSTILSTVRGKASHRESLQSNHPDASPCLAYTSPCHSSSFTSLGPRMPTEVCVMSASCRLKTPWRSATLMCVGFQQRGTVRRPCHNSSPVVIRESCRTRTVCWRWAPPHD